MTRYADPTRCPDCLRPIEYGAQACAACDLPLSGASAVQLFRTLSHADTLLAELRSAVAPALADTTPVQHGGAPAPLPVAPASPPGTDMQPRGGLGAASVPKILLGLGALCLLVAALVFLAVAWSALGVGGRTVVLLVLTALTTAGVVVSARRALRTAAESLAVVSFGLLSLDLVGADNAGWFGTLDAGGLLILLGVALAGTALPAAVLAARSRTGGLLSAQAVGAVGWLLLTGGVLVQEWLGVEAGLTLVVLVAVGAALLGDRLRLRVLAIGSACVASLWWLALLGTGLVRAADHPTLRELWLEQHVWPLLVAAAFVAAPAAVRRLSPALRVLTAGTASVLVTVAVVFPAFATSVTATTVAMLGVLFVAAALTTVVKGHWRWVPAAPLLAAAVWVGPVTIALVGEALVRTLGVSTGPWSESADVALPAGDAFVSPLLLGPGVLGLLVAFAALARLTTTTRLSTDTMRAHLMPLGALVAGSVLATLALFAVPLWSVVVGLLLIGASLGIWAHGIGARDETAERLWLGAAAVPVGLALVASLASDWLSALTLLFVATAGFAVEERGRSPWVRDIAEALTPLAAGGLIWTVCHLAYVDAGATAVPVLGVLGLVAIARHRLVTDVATAAVAVAAVVMSLAAASPDQAVWLAVYLTLAGGLVTAVSLIHADRRRLGWVGGFLLAAATWVRLGDTGVETPEAYTLPSAVALLVVGLLHLRRSPSSSTFTALAPGLTLGLVPSLLWVLADPVTPRAVLLGLACLTLVLAGLQVRWSAPLILGATVGALVVLREAAPYASVLPQWVLIGVSGSLLMAVGITWESRLREAKAASGYLHRLR